MVRMVAKKEGQNKLTPLDTSILFSSVKCLAIFCMQLQVLCAAVFYEYTSYIST